jgi:gamma-glutamyltranspeptidase/glutathione hydrolase
VRSRVSIFAAFVLLLVCGQASPRGPAFAGVYRRHAVAADHVLASQAGYEILEAGGNAADAAAATMLALGVASPASSGLGGGGFALYYRASDRSLTFLDFRETAPAAATATMFARREGDTDEVAASRSRTGGLAVAVPGEAAGIEELLARFGSGRVTRARIAAPAEQLARGGFPVSRYVSGESASLLPLLREDALLGSYVPAEADRIPEGTILRNPVLADTLRAFGREGASAIYRGAVARAIVAAVEARGGVLTMEDLAGYRVRERAPLSGIRFGRTWVTAPPESAGGFTLLQSLGLMERWRPPGGWRDGPAFRHALAESWKGAFVDRAEVLGDPDHAPVPLEVLLSEERIAARAAVFDPERARPAADYRLPLSSAAPASIPDGGGTSHLCVVDREGNVAAVTTTINLVFGSRVTAAGIVLNDEMDDFAREVGAPNAFGLPGGEANVPLPGRRPVSTMTPTIVLEDDRPVLCIGGAGGSRIVTAVEQVALFSLLLGAPIDEAITRRRVHHQGMPSALMYERGSDPALLLPLWRRGHDLAEAPWLANVHTIRIVRAADGTVTELHAASDPRKGGEPRGR